MNNVINKTKHRSSIIPYITIDGLKTHNPSKIANAFGSFYSNLGKDLASKIPNSTHSIDHYLSKIPRNINSLVMMPTYVAEIKSKIKQLPNKTSHGNDGISNMLLKQLCKSISYLLCQIFNESIVEGKFPTQMKMAEVIPLYKGKDLHLVINYRPILQLITILKLLEKIVHSRVYTFLENNNILYNSQYSFHSKHSCKQAILKLVGNIIQARNKGMHSAALFLDLLKAFNTLNHEVLLKILERYGICGICNEWFRDYLANRSLTAKIQTSDSEIVRSNSFDISYGTTQGSCLGPLLFIIFTNDIYLLPTFSKIILFVDDMTLLNSSKNVHF